MPKEKTVEAGCYVEEPQPDTGSDNQDRTKSRSFAVTVLERTIDPSTIVNFGLTLLCSWEATSLSFQYSLYNGGPASLVYGSILAVFGAMSIALSLAEMASMDPVVGAQYRWSAAFAPFCPEFWGLFQGWITLFAWIFAAAANPVFLSNTTISLIVFNYPSYTPERWHGTLLMWAFIILPCLWNFYFRKWLNRLEMAGGVCHVVFFIISLAVLVALAPKSSPEYVFQTLTYGTSGWASPGVCWSLGLVYVALPDLGFDGILHMSDEVKGARTSVPRSMYMAVLINGIMQFAFMIVLMFTIGDVDRVTNAPHALPIIEIFYQATNNKHAANLLVIMMAAILFMAVFNIFASVSRLGWAFAKDKGLPFHEFFSHIHPTLKIPLNSLLLVSAVCILLTLINIGSSVALAAAITLPLISLMVSYVIPILFIMIRKIQGRHPQYGPFKLGRWGIPCNLVAIAYVCYLVPFTALPGSLPVTAEIMNYSGPLVLFVCVLALADWFLLGGKRRFVVPVKPEVNDDDI